MDYRLIAHTLFSPVIFESMVNEKMSFSEATRSSFCVFDEYINFCSKKMGRNDTLYRQEWNGERPKSFTQTGSWFGL